MTDALKDEYRRYVRQHGVARLLSDEPPEAWPDPFTTGQLRPEDAERTIRALEAARCYRSYSTVGTEPRMDWLYRLGTVASRKGPYQGPLVRAHRETLTGHEDRVRRGVRQLGWSWPAVHVDVFPTGDLNAMSVPVPAGHLVLINLGLMNVIFNVLKIHVLSQRIGPAEEDRALLDERQVELLLAETVNAYLYGAGSWMIWSTPPLQGRRSELVAPVLGVCEDFVLAHEIAHVLAGDRLEPRYMSAPESAPVPGLPIPVASHEAEFSADVVGADIVRAALDVESSIGPGDERVLFGGLLFFFLIDEALRTVRARLEGSVGNPTPNVVQTHPRGADRMRRLTTALPPHHSTSLKLVQSLAAWLEHYLPAAMAHIEEVDATIVRRDDPWWRSETEGE